VQIGGAVQGVNTIPRRRRWNALLAVAAVALIAVLMALWVWVVLPATSGIEAEDAVPTAGTGSAIIHDDAGNVHPGVTPGYAIIHDDAGNVHPETGTGSAIIHDDAGNVNR